ncbi:nitronate monooxygenase family protein [Desulfosarcina sp. OttesenSCG-928-A07]|nr:nitronate monooxygenase family protein [Desulfosarcina sp. OttesenSCG-928-G17]MDL2329520.1 nitronate monooxygenase family protein [Desulfosarcina sp. OttesenSCG-928-A07]
MNMPELKIGHHTSRLPIIQGGMGVGISMSGLASAVANAGGIGVIAGAMVGIAEKDVSTDGVAANCRALTREIRKAKEKTNGIIGVNLMVALTHFAELVKTAIAEKADLIFAGAGLPMDLPAFLKKGDRTGLVPIISSGRAAALICKRWFQRYHYLPAAFVVEGPKAGGHLGFKPDQLDNPTFCLENLVQDVLDELRPIEAAHGVRIPVIAAGGVYDGADIRRFLEMGASGVQMGTRFVATYECDADERFKQAYVDAQKEDLMVIKSPVGLPGRALRNTFLEDVASGVRRAFKCPYHCVKTCDPKTSPYCIGMALAMAQQGKLKNGFAFAGANAHRVDKIVSVKELMKELETGYAMAAPWSHKNPAKQDLLLNVKPNALGPFDATPSNSTPVQAII